MKPRIFLTLMLTVVLALPVLAQTNPPSSDQSTSGSQRTTTRPREPIPAPTSKNFWDGDDPNLVNLVTHPFANKKYVQRQVGPIRDRINELDQLTSENGGSIKDVDTRATQGIQLASEKVNLADQHATDAGTKAQAAQTSANDASTRVGSVEQMVSNLDQYKDGGQTEIRFQAGQTVLSKSAKDALDQMAAAAEGSAQLYHRSPRILAGPGPGGDCQLAKDGGFGGAVSGAQSSNSGLPGLCDEYGQRARGWRRRNHGETQQRRSRGGKCDEE